MTTFDKHGNLATATVSPGSTVIGSTLGDTIVAESIEAGTNFPDVPFNITVWRDESPEPAAAEIMRATAYDGERTFTVERGEQETTPLAHIGIGWRFANTITAGDIEAIETAVTNEEAARAAEDTTLQGEITAETAARIAGDAATLTSAETYTDAETTARTAAVTAEANARAAEDTTLQGEITAETAARIAGDAATLASGEAYTDLETAARIAGDAATLATADTLYVRSVRRSLALVGQGILDEPWPPTLAQFSSSSLNGNLVGVLLGLRKGDIVDGVALALATAAAGTNPALARVGILDVNGVCLALSGDVGAPGLWTVGRAPLPFAAPYHSLADGSYYAVMIVSGTWGTTQPSIATGNSSQAASAGKRPGFAIPAFFMPGQADLPAVGAALAIPATLTAGMRHLSFYGTPVAP